MTSLRRYQKKSDIQHVLDHPDTYIGSVESSLQPWWVWDQDHIVRNEIQVVPGLYKLFDEVLVNAADHARRTGKVSSIDVSVNPDTGEIRIWNDGPGIDVEKHPDYDVYIPELIFSHLRTSVNYDKTEQKIVGGKNGFGVKLVFIWSVGGAIETVDDTRQLKYRQTFGAHLSERATPRITSSKHTPYTCVSFTPDYQRLGLPNGLPTGMFQLFQKRVIDLTVAVPGVKLKFNGTWITKRTFQAYIGYYHAEAPKKLFDESPHWKIGVCQSPFDWGFTQISFVNGIYTQKGGAHVDYVGERICKAVAQLIRTRKKTVVRSQAIKEQLLLFIVCDVINPAFDSQIKDYLTSSNFCSEYVPQPDFIEKVYKMVHTAVCSISAVKEALKQNKELKRTDGVKHSLVKGVPKLYDANWAGTSKSKQCILIICEGDSAQTGVVSGLSAKDRNVFGVYPVQGKIINPREKAVRTVVDNRAIVELKKIIGLESGKQYTSVDRLRYGRVVFITDQDLDGHHIKALAVNLFHVFWSTLLEYPDFFGFIQTPIIRSRKGSTEHSFYSLQDYAEWKQQRGIGGGWEVKYYKGLGTSTRADFQQYFKDLRIISYYWTPECSRAITMAFSPKETEERKKWLMGYDRAAQLDTRENRVSFVDFINRELIHFSKYDCDRNIPRLTDGLKISQRKILFSAFKKNLTHDMKVSQFGAYVGEHTDYHHGEDSLYKTIVGMAADYVGSSNTLNLLLPKGQFGSRIMGGKDAASPRYIFTQLNPLVKLLFPPADMEILDYLEEEGHRIEPRTYYPVLPLVVINGTCGIGTGFSSFIPPHHPRPVLEYLLHRLRDEPCDPSFFPWFKGFQGEVRDLGDGKFLTLGIWKQNGAQLRITELPIGTWSMKFKEHLDSLLDTAVRSYKDNSTDERVDFSIELKDPDVPVDKLFKLESRFQTNNMYLFNHEDRLEKYPDIRAIIDTYYLIRLDVYRARKAHRLRQLGEQATVLENKCAYIRAVIEGRVKLFQTSRLVREELVKQGFAPDSEGGGYDSLLKMPCDALCEDNFDKLKDRHRAVVDEIRQLETMSVKDLWIRELEALSVALE